MKEIYNKKNRINGFTYDPLTDQKWAMELYYECSKYHFKEMRNFPKGEKDEQ